MNHIQEDHRIRIYQGLSIRDSFTGLWTSIAKKQHFLRLLIPSTATATATATATTRDQIQEAIQEQSGQNSQYSSRIFEDYQVIYQKGDTVIVTNTTPSLGMGTFFAVEDTDCPRRYFICFAFSTGHTTESITGLIAYFNKKGICHSDNTILCNHILANYDTRNGTIRSSKGFFYHQTLVFLQIHRDTHNLLLFLSYIPYCTDIIDNYVSHYTNYTAYSLSSPSEDPVTQFKRFLYVPLQSGYLMLDLGSTDHIEERHLYQTNTYGSVLEYQVHKYMTITAYIIPKKEFILGFLEVGQSFPEKEYSDGYPIYCAKCLQKVVTASYRYKEGLRAYSSIHTGLGSGFCPDCRIRYSLTKKDWVCAEIRIDGNICDGFIYEGWSCRDAATHSQDQSVLQLRGEILLKYPYRERVQLQWIPAEDAIICAETARMTIGADFYVSDTPPLKVDDEI